MASDSAWPPRSPHAALLSSPSGRRKVWQYERDKENSHSPIKLLFPDSHSHDEDEDEETLKLQLAAIEAKLKLKKLQQNKARAEDVRSAATSGPAYHSSATRPAPQTTAIHVTVSPTKQEREARLQRSPRRLVLGIDKGVRSTDVSLRRAGTLQCSPSRDRPEIHLADIRNDPRSERHARRKIDPTGGNEVQAKSFSERMAEIRGDDKVDQKKRDVLAQQNRAALRPDRAVLDRFRLDAERDRQQGDRRSPTRTTQPGIGFTREEVLKSMQTENVTRALKKSRTLPDLRHGTNKNDAQHIPKSVGKSAPQGGDSSLYESFSKLNLSSRILPHSFVQSSIPRDVYAHLRLPDLLRHVTAPAYELPVSMTNYAVFGIIAKKTSPLDHKNSKIKKTEDNSKGTADWEREWQDGSQNQKKFMIMTLTDLTWSVDLFLFGTAVPRFHRLSPGTVVAVLDPTIMPPKKGREDTGAFSLSLHSSDDTILEIGQSRDLSFCSSVKKNGQACGDWINGAKTDICEFHLNVQLSKAQAGRMGTNAGTNGFGKGLSGRIPVSGSNHDSDHGVVTGRGLISRGTKWDADSGSRYYISSSTPGTGTRGAGAPLYDPNQTTARMLDADNDDPFIAEGQLCRDRDALLRKRMATQAKQHEIAKALSKGGGAGKAGEEYLRHRLERAASPSKSARTGQPVEDATSNTQQSAVSLKSNVMSTGSDGIKNNGKRFADDVRLSPMKKIKFLTKTGVKEKGTIYRHHVGADDDLDIV